MTLYKKSERVLKMSLLIKGLKEIGCTFREIGEFSKWKEVQDGRLQVTMTIYEMTRPDDENKYYLVSDVLGRLACEVQKDKKEVLDRMKAHGYKTTHDWYIQDYGMSEETWREWNNMGDE